MADYSGDFGKMQEEALARMRQMQKRSKTAVSPPPQPAGKPPENKKPPEPPRQDIPPRTDILGSLFGDIKIDAEKAMILLMMFVLYKNGADIKLLLALGYLLM